MNKTLAVRLVIDLIMTALLLLCFSYYWLGDNWHEIIGTGFFVFLGIHNFFNRKWFKSIRKMKKNIKEVINVTNVFFLILVVFVLLITSFLISKNINDFIKLNAGFTVRQIHILVSYYLLILASIHIGVRWQFVMNYVTLKFKIPITSLNWKIILRILTLILIAIGIQGSFKLDIGTRLSMKMTLDWWDFSESVLLFFVYLISVMSLYIIGTYYFVKKFSKKS